VATGLGLLTKANALFALAALPLSLLLLDWSADGRGTRVRRWCAGAGTAAVVALAIQSVMRLSGLYAGMGKVSTQIGAYHSVGEGFAHAWKYIRQNDGFGAALTGYLTIPLILGGLAGIVWLARSGRSRSALVLFAWFAGPVAIGWLLATNAYPRYILSAVPAFAVLAGTGAAWLLTEAHRHRGALLMAGAAVALTALALARDVTVLAHPATSGYVGADVRQYVTEWPSGNDYTRVAHELEALAGPGKVVVATTSLPPFSLAALLGRPHLIKGTGVAPVAWAVEARHGRTNFRLSPESDPQIRRARLAVFDESLTRFVPPQVLHGRVVFSQTRPRSGTTIVVVRARGGTGTPLSVP
jgi:hypothetical protein